MKAEYDFSKGRRGKFYRPDAVLRVPVYLDPDVEQVIRDLAERTGQDVDSLVNEWLRSNIRIVQSVQPSTTP
jgi:hypothetical protein